MYWNRRNEEEEDSNGPEDKEEDDDFNLIRRNSFSSSPFRRAKYVYHYDGHWKDDMMNGEGTLYVMKSDSGSLSAEKKSKSSKSKESADEDEELEEGKPDKFIIVYGKWKDNKLEKRMNKDVPEEEEEVSEIELM